MHNGRTRGSRALDIPLVPSGNNYRDRPWARRPRSSPPSYRLRARFADVLNESAAEYNGASFDRAKAEIAAGVIQPPVKTGGGS